jgi:hypothetical protein
MSIHLILAADTAPHHLPELAWHPAGGEFHSERGLADISVDGVAMNRIPRGIGDVGGAAQL